MGRNAKIKGYYVIGAKITGNGDNEQFLIII